MNGFDSLIHSMTTISTGGFSNKSLSFGYFDSHALESISIIIYDFRKFTICRIYKSLFMVKKHLFLKMIKSRLFIFLLISIVFYLFVFG